MDEQKAEDKVVLYRAFMRQFIDSQDEILKESFLFPCYPGNTVYKEFKQGLLDDSDFMESSVIDVDIIKKHVRDADIAKALGMAANLEYLVGGYPFTGVVNEYSSWCYLERDSWPLIYSHSAVSGLSRPSPIDGDDSLNLLESLVLIGERLNADPGSLMINAPFIMTHACITGIIDPRHPLTGIPFSNYPMLLPEFIKGAGLPDMGWKVWPQDINKFSSAVWGVDVYTESEINGIYDKDERPRNDTPRNEKSKVRNISLTTDGCLDVIGALAKAIADMKPDKFMKGKGGNKSINVGASKPSGDSGIVGHLIKGDYAHYKSSRLGEIIRRGIEACNNNVGR